MRVLFIDGNFLIIDGQWLDYEFMYRGMVFGFLKEKYYPVFKLKEASKKYVSNEIRINFDRQSFNLK